MEITIFSLTTVETPLVPPYFSDPFLCAVFLPENSILEYKNRSTSNVLTQVKQPEVVRHVKCVHIEGYICRQQFSNVFLTWCP